MGFIAAGIAASVIGAGVSAYGAKKNADAMKDASVSNAQKEEVFADEQNKLLDELIKGKKEKLSDLGNIFDQYESTGVFGNTDTLKNLRKAQEDFSKLAAGDFTGFESQLRKTIGDALVNTVGSGAPVGTFAGLAADTQMQYRQQGLQTSVGVSEFLSNEANKLLGTEFGIMDQEFESQYKIARESLSAQAGYATQAASTEGIGTQALGGLVQGLGSTALSYGMFNENLSLQQQSINTQKSYYGAMIAQMATKKAVESAPQTTSFNVAPVPDLPDWRSDRIPGVDDGLLPSLPSDVPSGDITPLSFVPASYRNYQSNFGILASVGRSVVQV